eukprot:jgi/Mesen1/2135/ME000152S01225
MLAADRRFRLGAYCSCHSGCSCCSCSSSRSSCCCSCSCHYSCCSCCCCRAGGGGGVRVFECVPTVGGEGADVPAGHRVLRACGSPAEERGSLGQAGARSDAQQLCPARGHARHAGAAGDAAGYALQDEA